MKRTPFTPKQGGIYRNQGGGLFAPAEGFEIWHHRAKYGIDFSTLPENGLWMKNIATKWTCYCVGIGRYEDGTIDWDYSLRGFFMD